MASSLLGVNQINFGKIGPRLPLDLYDNIVAPTCLYIVLVLILIDFYEVLRPPPEFSDDFGGGISACVSVVGDFAYYCIYNQTEIVVLLIVFENFTNHSGGQGFLRSSFVCVLCVFSLN